MNLEEKPLENDVEKENTDGSIGTNSTMLATLNPLP